MKPARKVVRKKTFPRNFPHRYSPERMGVEAATRPQRETTSLRIAFEIT